MNSENFMSYKWLSPPVEQGTHAHKLYMQYSLGEVFIDGGLSHIDTRRVLSLETLKAPIQTIIRSSSEPISAVLNSIGTENMLTIVIGEASENELSETSKMYSSRYKYMAQYPENKLHIHHRYHNRTIKQIIKSKNSITLVLYRELPKVTHNKLVSFCGPSEGGNRFTLHLYFKKWELLHRSTNEDGETFHFMSKSYAYSMLEKEAVLLRDRSQPHWGPAIKFVINGSNFEHLRRIYVASLDVSKFCRTFIVRVSKDCIEELQDTKSTSTYAIDSTWELKTVPDILYGFSLGDHWIDGFY